VNIQKPASSEAGFFISVGEGHCPSRFPFLPERQHTSKRTNKSVILSERSEPKDLRIIDYAEQ